LNEAKASGSSTPNKVPKTSPKPIPEYVEQEWQRVSRREGEDDLEWAAGEGENPEDYECVACNKTFRSEAAWSSHERSKKHLKEIEKLKRMMQEDNDELGLDPDAGTDGLGGNDNSQIGTDEGFETPVGRESPLDPSEQLNPPVDDTSPTLKPKDSTRQNVDSGQKPPKKKRKGQKTPVENVSEVADKDDAQGSDIEVAKITESFEKIVEVDTTPQLSKREKRKLREARKAEAESKPELTCNFCKGGFESKSKLFAHLKETGHTTAVSDDAPTARTKKKGRK